MKVSSWAQATVAIALIVAGTVLTIQGKLPVTWLGYPVALLLGAGAALPINLRKDD